MKKAVIFLLTLCSFAAAEEKLSYGKRAELTSNPLSARLLNLMESKQTNLALAIDVTSREELLTVADKVGPYICMLKTHIDILDDFDWSVIEALKELAMRHNFLLCEDRKFADIGNTVQSQYQGGIYRIVEWADLVTVHAIPGPGIIAGLKGVLEGRERGILLLVEMSSKGSLADMAYSKAALKMAEENADFVTGLITQNQFSREPGILHMTPGVKIEEKKDHLGQQYNTPERVVSNGSDVIIVGRGILEAKDPAAMAERYRAEGWEAYLNRLK
jgi:orotidine 5'-phosphate decarboxylase subfamily 1